MSRDARRELIDGLRAVAAFYENNSDAYYDGMTIMINMHAGGRCAARNLVSTAKAMSDWKDRSDLDYVVIAKNFSEKVGLQLFAPRAKVCRRVVVGIRTEPAYVLPAREEIRIPERAVDVVEWLPLLPGLDGSP